MLLEALNRNRGKGMQKITVEHVNVHPGGQAVVGVVRPREVGFSRDRTDGIGPARIANRALGTFRDIYGNCPVPPPLDLPCGCTPTAILYIRPGRPGR
jgi:hypothetical protein